MELSSDWMYTAWSKTRSVSSRAINSVAVLTRDVSTIAELKRFSRNMRMMIRNQMAIYKTINKPI